MPLAIELAAARVRVLSLIEIVDSLHDRFRLLTGGARTVVRRQQTLRASVDWSHALLTEPERVVFRRLAVFIGGFDLAAAQAVAGGGDVERYQVLDLLTLLVDKSLVVAENTGGRTRYRLDGAPVRTRIAGRVRRSRRRPDASPRPLHGRPAPHRGARRPSAAHRAGRNRDRQPAGRVRVEPRHLSPSAIARAHGLSVRTINRAFNATGQTVGETIRIRRLARARNELAELRQAHRDYRDQVGFADSSHFSRSFKACYGTSPNEFRDARVRAEQAGAAMQQTGPRVQVLTDASDKTGVTPARW